MVLLSNNPKFLNSLDESTRSSLQPDLLVFRNYSAVEIHEILKERARAGLGRASQAFGPDLPKVLEELNTALAA